DRCEGGAPREVCEVSTGRGGSPTKAVRCYPGSHSASASRAGLGTVTMTRRSPQNGPRRDTPEGCHAPSTKNEPERPPWNPRRASFVGPEDRKYLENGAGATGGALYNGGTQPGGVAGQGQMGNVG